MEEFDISGGTMVMTEELLAALSCLPKLRSVRWMFYALNPDRPVNSRPVFNEASFPVLEELHAGIITKDTLKTFDSPYFPPKRLRSAASAVYRCNSSLIKRYLEVIASDGESSMETLYLLQRHTNLRFNDIRKITMMKTLKKLEIRAAALRLSDQHMAQLLSGLPLLEYIKFSERSQDPISRPGNATLLSVHSLIQHCPLLERAELFLDAREIPSIPHPLVTEKQPGRLLRLRVGNSTIGDPEMVAEWLRGCLGRRYDRIRIWNPKGVDSRRQARREIEQAWGIVQGILGHDKLEEDEDFDAYVSHEDEVDYDLYGYESYPEGSDESD